MTLMSYLLRFFQAQQPKEFIIILCVLMSVVDVMYCEKDTFRV